MKYAVVNGVVTHISKVEKGTLARIFGHRDGYVRACKGTQKQYWKPVSVFVQH